MCSVQRAVCSVQLLLCSVQCAVCSVQWSMQANNGRSCTEISGNNGRDGGQQDLAADRHILYTAVYSHLTWKCSLKPSQMYKVFNKPGVAGVFYKHLCDWLIYPLWKYLQITVYPNCKSLGADIYERMFIPPHVSHVTYHVSCVMCLVSRVKCLLSCVTILLNKVVELVGSGSFINRESLSSFLNCTPCNFLSTKFMYKLWHIE